MHIAYQTVGTGPLDVVWSIGNVSNIDMVWEEPRYADFMNRLAAFSRVILFDRRGSGLSDRHAAQPTLEERVDDLIAVLDAAESARPALFGFSEGGTMCALFAAAHPQRVSSLVLYGVIPRLIADEQHPYGLFDTDEAEAWIAASLTRWGTDAAVPLFAASLVDDPQFCEWFGRNVRQSMSPGSVEAWLRSGADLDVWDVLPSIETPTLVVHRKDDALVPVRLGRLTAERIPGARFVELPGVDHFPFVGDGDSVIEHAQVFLTGTLASARPTRRLATLLVTELANGGARAAALGDQRWQGLLSSHDDAVRAELARHAGREVRRTADGFLAAFDGPARAIHCARAVADAFEALGLGARIGVHAGECEILGDNLAGVAVHVAARVASFARPGEILVSETVRDLVAGSGIFFDDPRTVELVELDGRRDVFPVVRRGASPHQLRAAVANAENVFRKDGEYWTATFAGKAVLLKDVRGLHDIAELLRRKGAEIHVLDLVAQPAPNARPAPAGGAAQPVLDERARAQLVARVEQLRDEVDEAEREANTERAGKTRQELEFIERELAAAYGLGGRPRTMSDPAERARKAVQRRIKDSIDRIERQHAALGNHLRRSIRTGTFCSYKPESPIDWST